jgi:hypothetical protein
MVLSTIRTITHMLDILRAPRATSRQAESKGRFGSPLVIHSRHGHGRYGYRGDSTTWRLPVSVRSSPTFRDTQPSCACRLRRRPVQSAGAIPPVSRARLASGATVSTTAGSRVESAVVLLTCPPCLQPMADDPTDAGLYGRLRLLNRPAWGEHGDAMAMRLLDVATRIGPEEDQKRDLLL